MKDKSIRVLILEDRPSDAELMLYELRQAGFEPDWQRIDNEADYLVHLDSKIDLILADHSMPQFDTQRALQLLHERGLDIPLIAVTGTINDELAAEFMQQGAADYLLKDRLARLGPAVKQALQRKQLRVQKQQADAALYESKERYRRLIEVSPDGIAVHSQERLVFINPAGARLLGAVAPTELIERSILDFVSSNHRAILEQSLQRLEAERATSTLEVKFRRLDGTIFDVEITGVPLVYQGNPAIQLVFRDITDRKLAETIIQHQLKELSVLHLVAAAGTEATDVDEFVERVTQIIDQMLDLDNFEVGLVDKKAERLHMYPSPRSSSGRHSSQVIPFGQGLVGQVVTTGEARRLSDVSQTSTYTGRRPGIHSALGVPLKVGEEVIGVIHAESTQLDAFSQADEQLLMIIAGQLAIAIDRIRLFETTRRRVEELEVLAEISSALLQTPTRDKMLPVVLDLLLKLLAVDGAALVLRDPATDKAVIELGFGTAAPFTGLHLPLGVEVNRQVIATGQPYVTADVRNEARFYRSDLFEAGQSVACVPLNAHPEIIGVLWASRRSMITEEEVQLLRVIGDIAANAIHQVTLYEEAARHVQKLTALRDIDLAITASPDLNVTLDVLLKQVIEQLVVDAVDIYLLNPQTQILEYAAGYGFQAETVRQKHLQLGEGYAGRAVLEERIINLPDLAGVTDVAGPKLLAGEEFRAYYAIPLITKGKVEGVLEIFSRAALEPDVEWLNFLEALAIQAAIAIENARLFTETQRLLQQTRQHVRQVQQIIDTVPEGMLLLDAQRRVVLANPTGRDYLARLTDARVGDTLTYLNERPIEELLQPLSQGLKHELVLTKPSHLVFEVDPRVILTGPYAGGWVLVIRDITQVREMQDRAQQQGHLVAVGQLAAGIAHDFNNILTGIIGFTEFVAQESGLSSSVQQNLNQIIQQSERAAQLVRQILDFGRRSMMQKQVLTLAPILDETINHLLKRTLPETIEISLKVEAGLEAVMINADLGQLQQVLTNLALNACDAMPNGGQLRFHLSEQIYPSSEQLPYPEIEPGRWLVLTVSDTGTGIPAEVRPHIFEPFYTTKEVGKGTGLGLAQVYGIIKQHGGEIDVKSQESEGTTFTIYFPISTPTKKPRSQPSPQKLPAGHGELILLVEDNAAVLETLRQLLTLLNYQVLTAENGQRALEVYDEHRHTIDLVLTDMMMPEKGGMDLLQALQKRASDVKVVAMSGYFLEAETTDLLSPGFAARLQKPLRLVEVAQTIHRVLRES